MTRTSVRSEDGWPSLGCSCVNEVIGTALAHAESPSTSPSMVGASGARDAVATLVAAAAVAPLAAGCAAAGMPSPKPRSTARQNGRVLHIRIVAGSGDQAYYTIGAWGLL